MIMTTDAWKNINLLLKDSDCEEGKFSDPTFRLDFAGDGRLRLDEFCVRDFYRVLSEAVY